MVGLVVDDQDFAGRDVQGCTRGGTARPVLQPAAADFDGDGWIDLFVTGPIDSVLYRNDGTGHFTDATASAGLSGAKGLEVKAEAPVTVAGLPAVELELADPAEIVTRPGDWRA